MLNLFLIQLSPELIGYDRSIAVVVAAESEAAARDVAAEHTRTERHMADHADDFGSPLFEAFENLPAYRRARASRGEAPEAWLTSASCTLIGVAHPSVLRGVVVESYYYS